MALPSSSKITLTNTDVDTVYIDYMNIDGAKTKIQKDIKNIIKDIEEIKKAYKVLRDHKATKEAWFVTSRDAVKAATKYEKNLETVREAIEKYINSSVLEYVLTQINELQKAQAAANTINTDAGTVAK